MYHLKRFVKSLLRTCINNCNKLPDIWIVYIDCYRFRRYCPDHASTVTIWHILQASLAARQLINALLQRDPASRLGSATGSNEIKQHAFFRGINWPLIRNMVVSLWFPLNLVIRNNIFIIANGLGLVQLVFKSNFII